MEAILEAAAQVFERHGYAAGTTNRIAERAGISVGSLYQYFPNKDAVLLALLEDHIDFGVARVAPLLRDLHEQPPPVREGLGRLTEALVELHRQRPGLHRVLTEEAPRPPAIQDRLDMLVSASSDAIAHYLRARPEVAVADVDVAARLVVHVIESLTHNLVIHPTDGVRWEDYTGETVEMLTAYLTKT